MIAWLGSAVYHVFSWTHSNIGRWLAHTTKDHNKELNTYHYGATHCLYRNSIYEIGSQEPAETKPAFVKLLALRPRRSKATKPSDIDINYTINLLAEYQFTASWVENIYYMGFFYTSVSKVESQPQPRIPHRTFGKRLNQAIFGFVAHLTR